MISFALAIKRLLTGFFHSFKEKEFQVLFLLTAVVLLSGVMFYTKAEGFSVIDALYFCVSTLTTVGSGDIQPQTDTGKLFTVVYLLTGIGLMFAFVGQIAKGILASKKR